MRVAASRLLRTGCAVAGIHPSSGLGKSCPSALLCFCLAVAVVPASTLGETPEEQGSPPPPATNQVEQATNQVAQATNPVEQATNQVEQVSAQELRQLFLQLQEQMVATRLAVEQIRQETRTNAAQNAEALANGLEAMQEAFAAQRARDWTAMRSSNELVLVVAGAFAAMSLLTLLIMTYFQWRMSKGLAEISVALPAALGLGAGSAAAALGPAEPAGLHLAGATGKQEKPPPKRERVPPAAAKSRGGLDVPLGSRLLVDAGATFRRRRIRALRTVVIVCLIFAAALALLLYLVTRQKLGFGSLHAVLKI